MEIKEILSESIVDDITDSWLYKAINEYLDVSFTDNSCMHGHPKCCIDPMHGYIKCYVLDEDSIGEEDVENIIIKRIFKNLVCKSKEVCEIFKANDDYNHDIRKMLCGLDFNIACLYEDKIFSEYWEQLFFIINNNLEYHISSAELADLYNRHCYTLEEIIYVLSYSMFTDRRWRNYFETVNLRNEIQVNNK